ncbi:AraC family transcriptional regulator [Algisphaera agarilytica]|uniref:AraC-like DNA-binding protein n=1 Tax=Algisphaera agarilytica TaxID=1385975 RepID=A0A7X0H3E0_9BACT|nr:AraC family transcriptional regulator [Algisphaera agarilytica]MBB6428531.1 AraC-like DNA-binding protein [Algisphaera agarilytica]
MAMSANPKNISKIDCPLPSQAAWSQVDYAPGGVCGPRIQQDVQMVILDRGSLRVTTDGREQPVRVGEVVCQWPGGHEQYAFDPDEVSTHRWVALTFDKRSAITKWLKQKRAAASPIRRESKLMRQLFDSAMQLVRSTDPAAETAWAHLALAYFEAYLMDEGLDEAGRVAPLHPALLSMRSTIAEQFAEPLTLEDLAAACSVSTNHLVRLCREQLDTTPMRLLWETRVDQGVELLRSTGLTISEIAYRVGFANPFHFSRRCKERHGQSPRALRQQAWATEG